jgi:hypothetical protein
MIEGWTGGSACALQAALRMSNEAFAERLGISARTIAGWHQKPTTRPQPEMQQLLDTALSQASPAERARFAALAGEPGPGTVPIPASQAAGPGDLGADAEAERRLVCDRDIANALSRLDELAGWEPGSARREVARRLASEDRRELTDRASRRRGVGQRRIAQALRDYYGDGTGGHGQYAARVGQGSTAAGITTSILTCPDWLDLNCPLTRDHDRLTPAGPATDGQTPLGQYAAEAAARRLAETLIAGTQFVDAPLYRLAGIDVAKGRIGGSLAVTRFAAYALTLDLLEGELADTVAAGGFPLPGSLPLRDRYLPSLDAVLDVGSRLCAGGALALCAIARPGSLYGDHADYMLLVQERSSSVINAARQLAVIPKGFHQPMADYRNDARIAATLLREAEEELFGRTDIDGTLGEQHAADPMHPARLSEPMRWLLTEEPGALRMECTGFGLNLVSGNFEFACLIVIDSDEFWTRFGGHIEANWESSTLSLPSDGRPPSLTRPVGYVREHLLGCLRTAGGHYGFPGLHLEERNGRRRYSAAGLHQVARRWTSQMVAAMSSTDSASSQPPSIHWNGQSRLAGW